ncbi:MAG: ferrochelatase [Rickettsiales bacterium]|nr:ferrochelatase [Rickettsiales bacterium]
MDRKKHAVILFNLGGPDNLEAVKPFLFNLFNDKNIIGAPTPIRYLLAKFISAKRESTAQEIYGFIGNKSPILEETEAQAQKLEAVLASETDEYKVFIAMRYWHPFSYETIEKVKEYQPDEVILLPLYPQFSTTTTGSSFEDWEIQTVKASLDVTSRKICCYHKEALFVSAHTKMIKDYLEEHKLVENYRILFSAHGLPEKIIKQGDPYQAQVEGTVEAIVSELAIEGLDYQVCYQSKVGPLEWIKPSTESENERAGEEQKPIVIVPVAFVSEHSETLVELDIEYKELADEHKVPAYYRVPTLSANAHYIESLAALCTGTSEYQFQCSNQFSRCYKREVA